MNSNLQDAFRGCLIGGACGDALGYPVEFMRLKEIKKRFGPEGILKLEGKNGAAVISDDTQMTLFTAAGLLEAGRRKAQLNSPQWQQAMWELLREWKDTQSFDRKIKKRYSWLWKVSALHERRAPGITCLSALEEEEPGTFDKPKNNSKGCGGVMRTAPVGLFFSPKRHTRMEILKGGALAAVQTHGHLMGCLPAGMLSLMVNDAAYAPEKSLKEIAREALRDTLRFGRALSGEENILQSFQILMENAEKLSETEPDPVLALKQLGEGWVGDEALAAAVYCVLRFPEDFSSCLAAAVNHDGDSDSTGAIAGNLLGARLGYERIRRDFSLDSLERVDVILKMADELYRESPEA